MKLLLRQFAHTLIALCARRRTYIGFAAFVFFDLVIVGMLQAENLRDAARHFYLKNRGYSAPENFSGLTIAHFVLSRSLEWLGALFPALIAGDMVAKEVEDGTMRMTLSRPVSRWRVLALRWVGCATYTCVFAFFVALVALACGFVDQGTGNLLVALPDDRGLVLYAPGPGVVRFALAIPFQAIALLTITSLAFLFSCTAMKPLAATVVTVSFVFADRFIREMPIFKVFRPWFLTTRLDAWIRIYEPEIPWGELWKTSLTLLALDVICLVVACRLFARRDLKP
jgi:ABC-2 type transport system permease protein